MTSSTLADVVRIIQQRHNDVYPDLDKIGIAFVSLPHKMSGSIGWEGNTRKLSIPEELKVRESSLLS
jgi:hypothetical protein